MQPVNGDLLADPTEVVLPPSELDQYLFGFLEHWPKLARDENGDPIDERDLEDDEFDLSGGMDDDEFDQTDRVGDSSLDDDAAPSEPLLVLLAVLLEHPA